LFVRSALPWYVCTMRAPRRLGHLFKLLRRAARKLTQKVRTEPPGMIGAPPSARGLTGRPLDIGQHASEVALEWEDVAEAFVQKRMRELGIPEHRIGAPDYERGGVKRAFLSE
jgi:hypothetical protein